MSQFDSKAKSALYWAPQLIISSIICGIVTTLTFNSTSPFNTLDINETLFKTINLFGILLILGFVFIISSLLGVLRYYLINKTDDFKRDFFALLILGIICIGAFFVGLKFVPTTDMSILNSQNIVNFYTNIGLHITIISLVILIPTTIACIINDVINKKKNIPYTNTSRIIKVMILLIATVFVTSFLVVYSASFLVPFIINRIIVR